MGTIAYFGTKLSKNIAESPEGYLICSNVVIGRTGFQKYKLGEISQTHRDSVGLVGRDDDEIDLYRSSDEVFAPRTIASFQGKPVTDTHPSELLTVDDTSDYARGHVTDVRRGRTPMEDGNFPLVATLLITDQTLATKILENRARDISCGYNYKLVKRGPLYAMVDLVGNHVAVCPNRTGRAGSASIQDSKFETDPYLAALDLNVKRARQAYSTRREQYGK